MSRREVLAFFRRCRTAFDRLDGDAVAGPWHTPSAIADTASCSVHARVTAWADDAPMRDHIRKMKKGAHAAQ